MRWMHQFVLLYLTYLSCNESIHYMWGDFVSLPWYITPMIMQLLVSLIFNEYKTEKYCIN